MTTTPTSETHNSRLAAPIAGKNARIMPMPIRLPSEPQRSTAAYSPTLCASSARFAEREQDRIVRSDSRTNAGTDSSTDSASPVQ